MLWVGAIGGEERGGGGGGGKGGGGAGSGAVYGPVTFSVIVKGLVVDGEILKVGVKVDEEAASEERWGLGFRV